MYIRKLLFIACLVSFYNVSAQKVLVENNSNPKLFPNLKFKVQTNNPHFWQQDDFKVIENNQTVAFELSQLKSTLSVNEQQNILVLVENLNQPERNNLFRQLVISFVKNVSLPNQKINIAVFDRVRENGTQPIRYLLPEYTYDKEQLIQAVQNLKPLNDVFGNNESSDLYHALFQGVTDISTIKNTFPYIVLFSTGFNNKWSSHTSSESVKSLALEKGCKIYSVQFYIQGFEHHKLTDVVEATFAEEIVSKDYSELENYVSKLPLKISENIGSDYFIQYQSTLPKNNNSVPVEIWVDGKPYSVVVKTPVNYWNIVIYTSIGLLILTSVIYFFIKKQRKLKAEINQFDAALQRKNKEQELLKHQIQDSDVKLNNLIRIASETTDNQHFQSAEEIEQLRQMKSIGKLPELYFEKIQQRIVINRAEFSIGRAETNDLMIQSPEISRTHCSINFRNNRYYITDTNSALGIWVNNQKVQQIELRHGDQLKLGNHQLTFVF